jgi:hypothetical protein
MPGHGGFGTGATPPGATPPGGVPPGGVRPMGPPAGASRGAGSRGFLSALFDFSFTSFVTTRIIKVLYVLITVLVSLVALFYTIIAFRLSTGFGLLVLIIGDPLYIIIVMAFWRLVLEAFVVVFRIAEDVRAIRERGGR